MEGRSRPLGNGKTLIGVQGVAAFSHVASNTLPITDALKGCHEPTHKMGGNKPPGCNLPLPRGRTGLLSKGYEMETQGDLIEQAIAAGRLTNCPPRCAAGHKDIKKKKGERVRPCPRCETSIKFVRSTWAAHGQRRKGWHWVNQDGTHHRCSDFRAVSGMANARLTNEAQRG